MATKDAPDIQSAAVAIPLNTAGVDDDGEGDEQDADGVGAETELLQHGHEADENDEAARIQAVNLREVVDKRPPHCEHAHDASPLFFFGHAAFAVDTVLLPYEHE